MKTTGIVFDIQKFCINDGPGVRTTAFLKGCQMRCLWCHNPESMSQRKQLSFNADKCLNCQACAQVCAHHRFVDGIHQIDFAACDGCGKCVEVCPAQALKIYGEEVTAEQIVQEVLKDKIYFAKTGGGITLSGGEALHQFTFALELARLSKQAGLHVCLETNGASKSEHYQQIAPFVDCFLVDYKATGDKLHKTLTGLSRRLVDQNMKLLHQLGCPVILRCPLIPGYNLSLEHFQAIGEMVERFDNILHVEILPYHNFGARKAREIGEIYTVNSEMPDDTTIDLWITALSRNGKIKVIHA
ncbi:glycyl-radical enzyme activating protein [Buttiauxella sp. WJP83]|uniref:glycyl-radical enzyme activating protein n=1 Tax=Buttiauxella sp. WJP83 TaxID=2986951 RepID=UPI0022DDAD04|nr:glycyl-radical enzyme activating protein [Buttiauxella sp. WJP83]WBM71817.1 glycyl-radical enzyme activating protein [Buttiauxella sp. WJP83]